MSERAVQEKCKEQSHERLTCHDGSTHLDDDARGNFVIHCSLDQGSSLRPNAISVAMIVQDAMDLIAEGP